jgi:hypothetical protein
MNKTNVEHSIFALIMQAVPGFLIGDWITGAAFAIGFFLSREHAQREYHIGDPSKLKGCEAFDIWNWSLDAKLDFLCPAITVLTVYWAPILFMEML